jgi:addiction module RelE/StbE family toxin
MYVLSASKKYQRQLKKLVKKSPRIKPKITKTLHLLSEDPKHSSLRTHKLSGKNAWSISVTMDIRILIGIRGNRIYLLEIGAHDEVY